MIFIFIFFSLFPFEVCDKLNSLKNLLPYIDKTSAKRILNQLADEGIFMLRGPKGDGTFFYAYPSMEVEEFVSFNVELNKQSLAWQKTLENGFGIKISVPKKKNLFWGNEDVLLKELTLILDGREKTVAKEKILKKGEEFEHRELSYYKFFEAKILFEKIKERDSLIEIKIFKAQLKDDPKNPNYPFLNSLLKIKSIQSSDFEQSLEEALSFCHNNLKRELFYIIYLLKGNPVEREEGIRKLEEIINSLK